MLTVTSTGDATTDRILDAAYELILNFGARRLSVEEVARRVGINRITIYRRYANKDELIRAVLLREGLRIFAEVDAAVAALPTVEDQIVEGFVVIFSAVRRHPLVERTLATEPHLLASLLTAHSGFVIALARDYLAGHLRRGQRTGQLRTFDPQGVAELAVRLSLSFLLTPESCLPLASDDDAREFARCYILPVLQ